MQSKITALFVTIGVLSTVVWVAVGCQAEAKQASVPPPTTPAVTQPPEEPKAPQPSIHKIWQDTDEELNKDGMTYHMTIQRDLTGEGTETEYVKMVANPEQDSSRTVEFDIKLAEGYALKDDHFTSYKGEEVQSSINVLGVEKQESDLTDSERTAYDALKNGVNNTVDFHIDKLTDDTLVLSDNSGHTYLYRAIDEDQVLMK